MTHYIIERLSWDTSGKEKETWKQCNKRDVEELSFVVEDLKEASLTEDSIPLLLSLLSRPPPFADLSSRLCVFAGWRVRVQS